jgi:hypothetical protein
VYKRYVTELAAGCGMLLLDEATYEAKVSGQATAEALPEGDDCNILVEAKTSLFADDVLIQDANRRREGCGDRRKLRAVTSASFVEHGIHERSMAYGALVDAPRDHERAAALGIAPGWSGGFPERRSTRSGCR